MVCKHLKILFAILCLVSLPIISNAQQRPEEKPRKVKPEKKDALKKWIEDVAPLMTEAERTAFPKLTTDAERENFIIEFWRVRDPDPDTEENEFKEEYYERVEYANEHFSSGIQGSKTDRGQIYLRWGKPDQIESHPSGGTYQRQVYEGGGSAATYPFEVWFYRYLPGVGSGIEVEFVDRTGSGEYKIASSLDEKEISSYGPNARGNITGLENNRYTREQDNPFTKMQTQSLMFSTPPVNGSTIIDSTDIAIDNNALEFDIRVDFFKQSDERVVTAFSIQTDNKNIAFADEGGIQTSRLNISGTITSVAQKRVGNFEEVVSTNATPAELKSLKERKSAYQKAIVLPPGVYRIQALVRDIKTGAAGKRILAFTVPKYEENRLSTSSLVLASRLQNKTDEMQSNQFIIGGYKVIPNVSGLYQRGQEVGIYLQVYNAGIDETTLRPKVDVEYVLQKDGKEILNQKEDWKGLSDSGQRLVLARLLPTSTLSEGEYELLVKIRDRVSGDKLTQRSTFTISK